MAGEGPAWMGSSLQSSEMWQPYSISVQSLGTISSTRASSPFSPSTESAVCLKRAFGSDAMYSITYSVASPGRRRTCGG
eukprot:scaffold6082_cov51-Phaeocystis_antarctica.AAC.5